jgi:parallel beta-helix repeat protein
MISGIRKHGRFLLFGAFVVAVAGCLPTTGGNGGGGSQTPACGTVLTADLVLQNDMTCAGPALVTNVPGITIDLNGHRISAASPGTGNGITGPAVSVKNGTISGFENGYFDSPNATPGTPAFTVDHVNFVDNHTGLLDAGDSIHITNSTFEGNAASGSTGLLLGQKSGTAADVISDNQFDDLETGLTMAQWSGASVTANTFSRDTTSIVVNFENSSIDISGNHIAAGGTGIRVDNENNDLTIENNTLQNGLVGIWVTSEPGFPNFGSADNVITGNTVTGNGAAGIAIVANWDAFTGMTVSGNTASNNGFSPGSATNAPVGTAPLNDGIYIDVQAGGSVSVADNHATGNADHGIAAFNVTDGHGNTASGNGGLQQCSGNITCS